MLGELLRNALYDQIIEVGYFVYTMCLWGILLFIVEYLGQYLGQKSLFLRGIFDGLIKSGNIDWIQLKKNRMNINQLQSLLRQSETFSIRDVDFCYLEANSSISILKKPQYQKVTGEDLNISIKSVHVPVSVIRDGKVLWDELKDLGFNESWLKQQRLSEKHLQSERHFIRRMARG